MRSGKTLFLFVILFNGLRYFWPDFDYQIVIIVLRFIKVSFPTLNCANFISSMWLSIAFEQSEKRRTQVAFVWWNSELNFLPRVFHLLSYYIIGWEELGLSFLLCFVINCCSASFWQRTRRAWLRGDVYVYYFYLFDYLKLTR